MMKQLNKVFSTQIKALDEKEQTLTALISTNAVDRMDEVLDPKGVELKHFKNNPVVLWAHDYEKQPIGKALWTKRSGEGIMSKIKFAPTALGKETFELYKEGFLNAFSVGFIPKAHEDKEIEGQSWPRRTFTKWELLEFSAVPVPANPEALALAMQKGMIKSPELIKAMEKPYDVDEPNIKTIDKEPSGSESENKKEIKIEEEDVTGLEDLIADNEILTKNLAEVRKELKEYKYKYYSAVKQNQKIVSEISEKNLAEKTAEVIIGEIRKLSGKLD